MEKTLIINAGSSSLKFTLYNNKQEEIVNGTIEKINEGDSFYTLKFNGQKIEKQKDIKSHFEAAEVMIAELLANHFIEDVQEITQVGHRVLHGGEKYSDSVLITEEVINDIKKLTKLGPLHHPGNLAGIEATREYLPNANQVAVWDTAFHQSMPEENYIYPIPYSLYEEYDVRKYGFHGTSHKYITQVMKQKLNKEEVNLIICHIGSGASISCIKDGKCFDTSMGLTPLAGVVMGTRSGDIDPSIIEYICKETGKTVSEVTNMLNKESGLKGIAGKNDFRDVTNLSNEGDKKAKLAITLFENSIVKYIAQYYFELEGNVDAIIFTAGVGENMSYFREDIINKLSKVMGICINKEVNDNIAKFKKYQSGTITTEDSRIPVMVIPTNEEQMILEDTIRISRSLKK